MQRAAVGIAIFGALLASTAQAAESPCARSLRDAFDRAGHLVSGPLDASALHELEARVGSTPDRCAPGDYRIFADRFADLLTVMASDGLSDSRLQLAAILRLLGPRQVSTSGYDAAFHAFLDARARLGLHAPPAHALELLALFDTIKPQEIPALSALGQDRDGIIQGLTELRRQLALGQVAAADAKAEELLRTLKLPVAPLDGGAAQGPSTGR
jgi:hypothetical protein